MVLCAEKRAFLIEIYFRYSSYQIVTERYVEKFPDSLLPSKSSTKRIIDHFRTSWSVEPKKKKKAACGGLNFREDARHFDTNECVNGHFGAKIGETNQSEANQCVSYAKEITAARIPRYVGAGIKTSRPAAGSQILFEPMV